MMTMINDAKFVLCVNEIWLEINSLNESIDHSMYKALTAWCTDWIRIAVLTEHKQGNNNCSSISPVRFQQLKLLTYPIWV